MKDKKDSLKNLYFWVWLCTVPVIFITNIPYLNPFTVSGEKMIKSSFRELVTEYDVLRIVVYDRTNSENVAATSNKEEIKTYLDNLLALKVKVSHLEKEKRPPLEYEITFSAKHPNSNYLEQYSIYFNDQYFLRGDKGIYYEVMNENELYSLLKIITYPFEK